MTDQIPLIGPRGGLLPRSARKSTQAVAGRVQVLLETALPQLDRLLDFAVPKRLAQQALPGVRVRVTVAGQRHSGFIVAVEQDSDYDGPLRPLDAVVSSVPVLTPEVLQLCQAVASHYAGGLSDVVRLAVPPRVASSESGWIAGGPTAGNEDPIDSNLASALDQCGGRAVWTVPPGTSWVADLVGAATTVAARGQGVLIVLPDGRDVEQMEAELGRAGNRNFAVLRAEEGPTVRYRNFLKVLAGKTPVVIGTRAAVFAPVPNIGLMMMWDDGDPTHSDPRTPYPHVREVLTLRSHLTGAGFLIASRSRTCESQRLVERGWAADISERLALREAKPLVTTTDDRIQSPLDLVRRFPQAAVNLIRQGLTVGPVLIQVARTGYIPVSACQNCRNIAACPACEGAIEVTPGGSQCRRCDWSGEFHCPECGSHQLRAVRTGAGRTAEEVARLFPRVPVTLRMAGEIDETEISTGIVVATPGLEPELPGGYAAAYLPDAQDDLWLSDARAGENALRRWFNAVALVRPGARVMINADPAEESVQALIRWDPVGFARAELHIRAEAELPPAQRLVQLDGGEAALGGIVAAVQEQVGSLRVLGPRQLDDSDQFRTLLTGPDGVDLVSAVRRSVVAAATAGREPVRVHVDPVELD
ncbi:MAG: primosome assembly protein PriA [Micrococcales bacterium]|nr:primosome assembly protein PriA [Micrococcales bacterium]